MVYFVYIMKNPIGIGLSKWGTLYTWSAKDLSLVRIMFPKHLIDFLVSWTVDNWYDFLTQSASSIIFRNCLVTSLRVMTSHYIFYSCSMIWMVSWSKYAYPYSEYFMWPLSLSGYSEPLKSKSTLNVTFTSSLLILFLFELR